MKQAFAIPDRRLLTDGELVEMTDLNKRKLRHIFLFNDMILCTTQPQKGRFISDRTYEFRWWIRLAQAQIGPIEKVNDKGYLDGKYTFHPHIYQLI
jgi:hypothetical protein